MMWLAVIGFTLGVMNLVVIFSIGLAIKWYK